MTPKLLVPVVAYLLLLGVLLYHPSPKVTKVNDLGSIMAGEAYYGTTTPLGVSGTVLLRGSTTPVTGILGSVVVYGSNTGTFCLYDATTSDITKRTGGVATTTITLFCLPATASSTTYTLDQMFTTGLLFSGSGSTVSTSTITWK